MPSLTSLPLSIQSKILYYLFDARILRRRALLRGSECFLPFEAPYVSLTLEGAKDARAHFPVALLAPALASPVLAEASCLRMGGRVAYLTDRNTEGRLPLWIKAFAPYVRAVSISDVAQVWYASLPLQTSPAMMQNLCLDTVEMFKQITINHVRLSVLDLVNVPFNRCKHMKDPIMTGLCATLESCQTTLEHLALPIYPASHLCTRALATVTLPHLTVFSIELKNPPRSEQLTPTQSARIARRFLRMMQAVDGHADRLHGITTLQELRLINLYQAPCTERTASGCSASFFRAITTLRVSMNRSIRYSSDEEPRFFSIFRALQYLYWTGMPLSRHTHFEKLCNKLQEVHLCHHRWITNTQVGSGLGPNIVPFHTDRVRDSVWMSNRKIRTLVTYDRLVADDLQRIANCCPDLEHLSFHVTPENVYEFAGFIEKCKLLKGLEVIVDEYEYGRLGKDGWQAIANAIPRRHAYLQDIAIQTPWRYLSKPVSVAVAVDCFVTVIERMGFRARRLVFRAPVKPLVLARLLNQLCRVLDACVYNALCLTHLEVDLAPKKRWKTYDEVALIHAEAFLRATSRDLVLSLYHLQRVDLGYSHSFFETSF